MVVLGYWNYSDNGYEKKGSWKQPKGHDIYTRRYSCELWNAYCKIEKKTWRWWHIKSMGYTNKNVLCTSICRKAKRNHEIFSVSETILLLSPSPLPNGAGTRPLSWTNSARHWPTSAGCESDICQHLQTFSLTSANICRMWVLHWPTSAGLESGIFQHFQTVSLTLANMGMMWVWHWLTSADL
jgi:hypothetical protein